MSRSLVTLLLTSSLACGSAFALPQHASPASHAMLHSPNQKSANRHCPGTSSSTSSSSSSSTSFSSTELSMSLSGTAAAAKSLALSIPRAGGQTSLSGIVSSATANPVALFDSLLIVLASGAVGFKAVDKFTSSDATASADIEEKPAEVKSLQLKFLAAFWLLRCGYWMSGPYVVPAYKSKVFGGVEASMSLVSKIFLSGFAATAIVSTTRMMLYLFSGDELLDLLDESSIIVFLQLFIYLT